MPETSFGNLLNRLSEVLEDEGFIVTPDQIVRAHAVMLRLGVDRSPSGLVSILAPIFCTSSYQQEQFAALFIRALDLSSTAGDAQSGSNPHVIGRAAGPKQSDPDEADREMRQDRAAVRAEMPKTVRTVTGAVVLVVLLVVLAAIGIKRLEPEPKKVAAGLTASEIQVRKESIPKQLPQIDGRGTLDIQIDSSGHEVVVESLVSKSPVLGLGLVALVLAALGGLSYWQRGRRRNEPAPGRRFMTPKLPDVLRYGRDLSVGAANRLLIPGEESAGRNIDVLASIRQYVRTGYWKGLSCTGPVQPDYVALVRFPDPADARSLVQNSLIRELESLGVAIDAYYFHESPKVCVSRDTGRRVTLQDLARERRDDRLLLFSDGQELIDAQTGRLFAWANTFRAWKWRRLAIPALKPDSDLPTGVRRLFGRTPATMKGFSKLGLSGGPGSDESGESCPDWRENVTAKVLADRLRSWLGPRAFQWFATCATYSDLNGALVLYLGEMPELGELTEDDLERVLALPYVVDGHIPHPLRMELLDSLNPAIAKAARKRVVNLMKSYQSHTEFASSNSFKVEYAALRWLVTRDSEDREKFASAIRTSSDNAIPRGSALYALTEHVMPFWTRRRIRHIAAWSGMAMTASLAAVPFFPLFTVESKVRHEAAKPLGTNFGEWICFTKIEQVINWRLPPDTQIKRLAVVGYDQTAVGEGFQLVSRAERGVTVGPIDKIESGQVSNASLVFAPLHAKEYTGVLNIDTNHGRVAFNLRGTGVYGGDGCVDEGHGQFGLESDFNGNGCNQITEKNGSVTALLAPARPTGPSDTHSALVLGPWRQGDFDMQCGIRTIAQLRDDPYQWEVGWLIWNFVDLKHFYYLALKANGWELGRKDNLNPSGQRFLATKDYPVFPPGRRYLVNISRRGDTLSVDVDGKRLVSIEDNDHPVTSGRIGFYSECAATKFDSLEIK